MKRLRTRVAQGLAPEAFVRAAPFVFGPYVPFPVAFRVMGPDIGKVRAIANEVESIMRANPNIRQVNQDWGTRVPKVHFVLDQDRLRLIGLSSNDAAQQLQFLLTGVPVTQVREDIRTVDVVARTSGSERLDPSRLADFTLTSQDGRLIPLAQIGRVEVGAEDPILKRRDRTLTIEVRGDTDDYSQPPDVATEISVALRPLAARLPDGYRIEMAGNLEKANEANTALARVFPVMIVVMLIIIMLQVRSFPAMAMVFLTAPLGLAGAVPILLAFGQPFGFDAILGLIGLAGILMRNCV